MKWLMIPGCIMVSTLAQASESGMPSVSQIPSIELAPAVASCADFSGDWSGTCAVSEQGAARAPASERISITAAQEGCTKVRLGDGPLLEIGVASNQSYASPRGHRVEQYGVMWADEGRTLRTYAEMSGFLYESQQFVKTTSEGMARMLKDGTVTTSSRVTVVKMTGAEGKPEQKVFQFQCQLRRGSAN